jgi:hypothetical protein
MKITSTKILMFIFICLLIAVIFMGINIAVQEDFFEEDSLTYTVIDTDTGKISYSNGNYQEDILTNYQIVDKINRDYYSSHTYSADVFDCEEMSIDLWNQLETQGIKSKICFGNVEENIFISPLNIENLGNYINNSNHLWVIAEVEPFKWIAVEATSGTLMWRTDSNTFYYENTTCFENPKDYKDFMRSIDKNLQSQVLEKFKINFISKLASL